MEDKEGQTVGNKGKLEEKSGAERSNGGGTLAGLDKECDYAPRERKERKNESGNGHNLEEKVRNEEPMVRELMHRLALT